MTKTWSYRPAAALIMLLALGEAGAASLVPFYNAGYELEYGVLLAVLMPFLLWGMFMQSLRASWTLATGLVLLAICLALLIPERYVHYNGYSDDLIYWLPTLAAAIVLPIAHRLGRRADDAAPA